MADQTYLYHITHLRNLPSMISHGALCCNATTNQQHLTQVAIGYQDLKSRRARRTVPVGPGGMLSDYVPWYFAPRSPMLYVIHKGSVPGYNEGQEPIVHLVTSIERIHAAGLEFVFTDGHAYVQFSEFFTDLADLSKVDFEIMKQTYWNDTQDDNDRERRRNAEFLVHKELPWSLVGAIGVRSHNVAEQLAPLLPSNAPQPPVLVRPQWYY